MNDGKTLRQVTREEIDKLKQMNFTEKRQHIWEYYKAHMIFLAVVFFLLFQIISHIVNPPPRDYVYIGWVGPTVELGTLSELSELLHFLVEDPERERVLVSSYAATHDPQMNAAIQTRFAGMIQTGSLDILLTTQVGVGELAEIGLLRDLREIAQLWQKAYDLPLFFSQANEQLSQEADVPLGISLYGSAMLHAIGISTNDLYLTVLVNTDRYAQVTQVLEALLSPSLKGAIS